MANPRRRAAIALALVACIAAIAWWLHDRGGNAADAPAGAPRDRVAIGTTAAGPLDVRRARIAGTVVLEGVPVAGASVHLAGTAAEQHVATDAAGRFDFGSQPIASYIVVAEAPRVTGTAAAVDLADPSVQPDQLVLVLHVCNASLHGTIHDTGGGAIAGARIWQADRELATGAGTEAAADGSYDLCLPVGEDLVRVTAEGYAQVIASVSVYGRVRRDFALGPEAIVVGKVERGDDHTSVAGAVVELHEDFGERAGWPLHLSAASDASGQFRIAGVPAGRYLANARADRWITAHAATVIAEVGVQQPVTCVLSPVVTVGGKVIDRTRKTPVVGATVYITRRANPPQRPASVLSQRDGSFSFPQVLAGSYEAMVGDYDFHPPPKLAVGTSDVTDLVLEVEDLASIAGRVTRGGKPVDGATIQTDGAGTRTDHDGRFTLRGLAPGSHRIYAESRRVGAFTKGPTIEVGAAEHRTGVEIELELAAAITGTVVDQKGAPVAGVALQFSLVHGEDSGVATTADDGSFAATALSGGGNYVYDVRPTPGSPIVYPPVHGRRFPPIAVRDGQTRVMGVRVEIRLDHLAISGHVLTAAGAPVPDVVVRASSSSGQLFEWPSATTDVTGAFTIRELQAGTYHVRATSPRGDDEVDQVAAGRTDLVLRLPEPGAIEGTLEGFAGVPQVIAIREYSRAPTAGEQAYSAAVVGGSFSIRNLSPGNYLVAATSDAGEKSTHVTVESGMSTKVALRARGLGAIAGTVVDAAHQPLAGLYCQAFSRTVALVLTDVLGAYRIDDAFAGDNHVFCEGQSLEVLGQVEVVAGQTAQLELVAKPLERPQSRLGMELEARLGQVIVTSVEPGGPAAAAGIRADDVIVEVDGTASSDVWSLYEVGSGTTVKLSLERGDQQLTVSLTIP